MSRINYIFDQVKQEINRCIDETPNARRLSQENPIFFYTLFTIGFIFVGIPKLVKALYINIFIRKIW